MAGGHNKGNNRRGAARNEMCGIKHKNPVSSFLRVSDILSLLFHFHFNLLDIDYPLNLSILNLKFFFLNYPMSTKGRLE